MRRLPLRARLTALYAVVFLVAAVGLLALTVVLVNQSIGTASGTNSAAQKEYRASLERALQAASGKTDVASQKQQQELKEKLIAASNDANGTVRADTVNTLVLTSLIALAVLVPAAGFGCWLLAGRALRPVGKITEAARRASETRLHDRLAMGGPRDEITELADTFDDMLGRLEHAFEAQRRFVANASHELRTPLAVARTAIDVTMAKPERTTAQWESMAADVGGAVTRAEHLVDGLLTLTRSQHLTHKSEPLDLATSAQDAIDALTPRIVAGDLSVHAYLSPTPAVGDRALLDRLVSNLVDNAVSHNHPGGWLSVHTVHDGNHSLITVTNSGPSVDPARIPHLFEPFQRTDGRARSADNGLGLGLSIVRAIADAHHASVTAVARPEGGLVVSVRL